MLVTASGLVISMHSSKQFTAFSISVSQVIFPFWLPYNFYIDHVNQYVFKHMLKLMGSGTCALAGIFIMYLHNAHSHIYLYIYFLQLYILYKIILNPLYRVLTADYALFLLCNKLCMHGTVHPNNCHIFLSLKALYTDPEAYYFVKMFYQNRKSLQCSLHMMFACLCKPFSIPCKLIIRLNSSLQDQMLQLPIES
jgi:hypothetical protein